MVKDLIAARKTKPMVRIHPGVPDLLDSLFSAGGR